MVEQWPFRSSLLIQLLRDYINRGNNGIKEKTQYCVECKDDMSLSTIFRNKEKLRKLLSLPPMWKDLCSLDDNPQIFESFLKKKKDLKFGCLRKFLKYMINADFSLQETFALAIAQARIN